MNKMTSIIAPPLDLRREVFPVARRALLAGAVLAPLAGLAAVTARAAPAAALL